MNNKTNKPTTPEGWTEWTYRDDKPYPETLDTFVEVLFADGSYSRIGANLTVEFLMCAGFYSPNCWITDSETWKIIAYKVAEEK